MIKAKYKFNFSVMITMLLFSLTSTTKASVSVKVFSYNEAMSDSNLSKPRIYIQNTGTETINELTYRYYFNTENGKTPSLKDYYIPNEQIMLVPFGSGYYVEYRVTGVNITTGGLHPHSSGNCIGLHYNDWSTWNKTNDFSDNQKYSFAENQNITVYYKGTKIYGNEPSSNAGSVLREVWTGISGISTDDIPLSTTPQITGSQSDLDAARNYSDNYGVRLRGYITAPLTGNYTFWIASDDNSKLFLSTDDNPANKGNYIASVTGYTAWMEWNKYASQRSSERYLVAGNRYYIEILHKDGLQDDNCSVGWLKPGDSGPDPTIVPSTVLTPYVEPVIPAVPLNLTATTVSSQQVNLTWTDASNNEYGFRLEIKKDGETFTEFAIITANMTSYQITGLTPETKYYFRIKSYNHIGNSDFSNSAEATTFAVPAGSVTREVWTNVNGTLISDIPLSTPANIVDALTTIETPQQWSNYYGQRIRGYIIPPQSGTYYFWISSDDNSQLWLSNGSGHSAKVMIASISGYTDYRIWDKYPSQKSSPVTLSAGVRYYFEVLHKEGNQNDNLSVWWSKPGQSSYAPSEAIPSSALSPYIIPSIPNTPNSLTATPISSTQIDLIWTDNSNNEEGFRIERALGTGPFVEIGTAGANVTVFHDAALSANTQYTYRVRAYNGLGNSGYSPVADAVTLENVNGLPPIPELLSFAVYSSEKTTLKDHCVFNGGGAVGSNTDVEVFPEAIIYGNAVSGGNILLKSQATVYGDVKAAGTVTIESGASVNGTVIDGATIATVEIPEISTISVGSENVTVNSGETRVLSPGYYKNCIVSTGGTLTLSTGLYTFSSFFLQPDADVVLDVAFSEMIDIEIEGDLEFSDNSAVIFADEGYVPFIRFYTNDANSVRIGCNVQLNGTLIAPHGNIAMYSGAQCSGALYAKTITIEPDAVIISEMTDPEKDSDGDHIANILEVVMGTDPFDSTSFYPIAVPSKAIINNSSNDVSITYDYSIFFRDYPFATEVPATFPAGSLVRSYIPMLIYVSNKPSAGDTFSVSGNERIGRFFNFRSENSLNPGMSFQMQVPFSETFASLEKRAYQSDGTEWALMVSSTPGGSEESSGINVVINSLEPIAVGAEPSINSATVYFDNGCVFSRSSQIQLHYLIDISDEALSAQNVTLRVEYTDLTTGLSDVKPADLNICALEKGRSFSKSGKFVFANPVQIDKIVLVTTDNSSNVKNYEQICGTDFKITIDKSMQILAKTSVVNINSAGSSVNKELIAVNYSQDITFESSNFGDGRIIVDYSGAHTQPYAYEYFLKDHLGSTRMVINDQGIVTEAVMYQPYGTMSDVPGGVISAPVTVREKFTGKELDGEGALNGASGIGLNYFGKRYYNPELGVFISTDPQDQYWNAYSYCGADPVNYYDPDGSFAFNPVWLGQVIGLSIGAVAGGITGGIIAHERGYNVGFGIFAGALAGGAIGGLTGMGIGAGVESGLFNILGTAFKTGYPLSLVSTIYNIANTESTVNDATQLTQGPYNNTQAYGNFKAILDYYTAEAYKLLAIEYTKQAAIMAATELGVGFGLQGLQMARSANAISLSRSQARHLTHIDEIVHNWQVRRTLSGEILDAGHITKIKNGIQGLTKHKDALLKSLDNPTLNNATRKVINKGINTAEDLIKRAKGLIGG